MGAPAKRRAHARGTRQGDEEEAPREPCRRCTVGAASVRRATLATRVSIASHNARVSVSVTCLRARRRGSRRKSSGGLDVVRNESWFRHRCCSFEPRRDTRARGRVRRRHSREPRDGEYAGAMPDGRGGVSALVRAAVASADASSLKVLDLSFNALVSLDDDGTPVEAGGCFASLPALEDLRVGDNALTTLRSSNLERLGDTLRSLRAQNNALRCLTGLEKMRALETLRVDGNASLGSPDIEQRTSLPGIPGVVNGLASLPSALTCLNLSRCALTSLDGFQNAACARRLEELRLDGNAFAAPNAFEPLRNCARLVELHVADARLTPASLAGLRALAPTLETLVLDGNPGLAERAKESSRTMHTKKQLIRTTTPRRQIVKNDDARDVANALENDDVGVLALRRAPRLPALTSLSVSRCGARALGPSARAPHRDTERLVSAGKRGARVARFARGFARREPDVF